MSEILSDVIVHQNRTRFPLFSSMTRKTAFTNFAALILKLLGGALLPSSRKKQPSV